MPEMIECVVTVMTKLQPSDGSTTPSDHRTNSETAIHWCSLKYNRALKSHPNIKVHINHGLLFVSTMGLLSIIKLTFAKLEFLKSSTVKASLNPSLGYV